MKTVAVGDIVRLAFLDHMEDADGAAEFEVFGRVALFDEHSITVDSWGHLDPDAERDGNIKSFSIVKRAIFEVDVLVPAREPRLVRNEGDAALPEEGDDA